VEAAPPATVKDWVHWLPHWPGRRHSQEDDVEGGHQQHVAVAADEETENEGDDGGVAHGLDGLEFGDALFEAVETLVGLFAVGADVDVEFFEADCDVLDGGGQFDDGVAAFGRASGVSADTHCADGDGRADNGGEDLDHGGMGAT